MSHPAASVKSIYSGKVNFEGDDSNPYVYNNDLENMDDNNDKLGTPSSHMSNLSISSRNLRTLNDTLVQPVTRKLYKQSSSTNISLVSSSSDYQHNVSDIGMDLPSEANSPSDIEQDRLIRETLQYEDSRPMSRNSTTSCLSTTATKDGVEGKRFHRQGPSPYSAAIIQNMIQSQNAHEGFTSQTTKLEPLAATNIQLSPTVESNNMSQVSFQTTNAEFDGEPGERRTIQIDQITNSSPPVTLKEKIKLLDNDL